MEYFMNEKVPPFSLEMARINFPEVIVACNSCTEPAEWSGVLGPVDEPDLEHFIPFNSIKRNPLMGSLRTHHNTVRGYGGGHGLYSVYLMDANGEKGKHVGTVSVSSQTELFTAIEKSHQDTSID